MMILPLKNDDRDRLHSVFMPLRYSNSSAGGTDDDAMRTCLMLPAVYILAGD